MGYLGYLIRSKGMVQLRQRALSIAKRYGLTPGRMVQAIEQLVRTLERYGCRATLPVTAVTLARHPGPLRWLQSRGIELAVHGWLHVDLERCPVKQQCEHLARALQIFDRYGISARGFRSPYLRRSSTLAQAAEAMELRYLSNQPILWETVDASQHAAERVSHYRHAVRYYAPWSSRERLSLPFATGKVIEIPVSLPDDEMLVERLGANRVHIAEAWSGILQQTYARGELFTLLLHPERTPACIAALDQVLSQARDLTPPVWIARLDEVADWWQQKEALRVAIADESDHAYRVLVRGDGKTGVLVRSATVLGASAGWLDGYQIVPAQHFGLQCGCRPAIGVSERTDRALVDFLERQGYAVEARTDGREYGIYFDRPVFDSREEKSLVDEIETSQSPLVRINRWPGGARSALAITGDIDALTLWDYAMRLVGN
jgi:peptidoglycan/xylan/chitin deacetylase (PgdA/CDA1 family)